MNDIYNLMTETDVKHDEAAILDALKGIHDGRLKDDLRVLNYFKEIPVSYDSEIILIDDGMVELKVHQNQAVVMHVEKSVFLKSKHFAHDVVAKVFKSNISKCIGLLHSFSYAQIRADRRQFVRVQITDNIQVNFRRGDANIDGRLVDISIGGLSLESVEEIPLNLESTGTLTVAIPNGKLEIPGSLLKIATHENKWYYIFEIEATARVETAISQFIFQKQVEIIRELKDQIINA